MIKLDKKDFAILDLLYENGRISNTQLAKRVAISKEVAAYRLKKLENEGLLKMIIPIIDFSAIDYEIYRIQFKFKLISKEEKLKITENLKTYPHVSWIVELQGNWDLAILFFIQSNKEFQIIYNSILNKHHNIIHNKLFTIVTGIKYFAPVYLTNGKKHPLTTGDSKISFKLDDTAKSILELLLKNGKAPLAVLAKQLNLAINTIKYHIKKLEKNGVIVGYRPILDISKIGYEHFKVFLNLENIGDEESINKTLSSSPNVVYITRSLGQYDIEFEAQYERMQDLLNFLSELKTKFAIREQDIIYGNKEILINEVPFD